MVLLKQTFSIIIMYKYVELNTDIYLGYIILCLKHLYTIKNDLWIFTSEWNLYFSLLVITECISTLLGKN